MEPAVLLVRVRGGLENLGNRISGISA
jgi:hypothetical protein